MSIGYPPGHPMPSNATPVSGDVLAEKYRLERLIGEGGMGCVFEAVNLLTDKRVAVKWLKPELADNPSTLQRFLREARLTSRIEHPNVVQVFDVAKHEGAYFLVMELLQGESLAHAVATRMLPVREAIDTMIAVMRGVSEAHAAGVIHRDLKPDNIFLCVDRRGNKREPKVLDFGISKLQQQEKLDSTTAKMTREGQMLGTPYYMSPEQLEASPDVDARADVYALGVIMYEVLTRRVPFEADTLTGIMMRIIESNPRPPRELRSELSAELDAVVLRAMSRDRDKRYTSVEDLARALEPFGTVRFSTLGEGSITRSLPYMKTLAQAHTQTPMVADDAVQVPVRRVPPALWIGVLAVLLGGLGWLWVASNQKAEVAEERLQDTATPRAASKPVAAPAPPPAAEPAPTVVPEPAAAAEPVVVPTPAEEPAVEAAKPAEQPSETEPSKERALRALRRRAESTAAQPVNPQPSVAQPSTPPPAPPAKPKRSEKAAPELVDF